MARKRLSEVGLKWWDWSFVCSRFRSLGENVARLSGDEDEALFFVFSYNSRLGYWPVSSFTSGFLTQNVTLRGVYNIFEFRARQRNVPPLDGPLLNRLHPPTTRGSMRSRQATR